MNAVVENKKLEEDPLLIEPETVQEPVQNMLVLPNEEEKPTPKLVIEAEPNELAESKESIFKYFETFTLQAAFEDAETIAQFSQEDLLSDKPFNLLKRFHSWQLKVGRTANLTDIDTAFLRYRNEVFLLNQMFENWDKRLFGYTRNDLKNIQAAVDYAREKIFPRALELFKEVDNSELCKEVLCTRMALDRLAYPRWQALQSPDIELEEDYYYAIPIGLRTEYSNHWLGFMVEYNAKKNQLEVNNKEYGIVSGQVTNFITRPLAYCGSSNSREIIILDPENSPRLNTCYETFKALIVGESKARGQKLSLDKILTLLMSFIRQDVYEVHSRQLEQHVEDIFDEEVVAGNQVITRLDGSRIPLISLETYLEKKKGVCRHLAFTAAYLLDRLQNDPEVFLDKNRGVVRLARHHLTDRNNQIIGAHTWINFISDNGESWHFDPMWGILKDFEKKTNYNNLYRDYGLGVTDAKEKTRIIQLTRAKN